MEDNPALSPRIRARYRSAYSGVFYRRFVLGEWTAAQGLVYDFFDRERDCAPVAGGALQASGGSPWTTAPPTPASFGLWGRTGRGLVPGGGVLTTTPAEAGRQKTDAEYARDLRAPGGGAAGWQRVIVDPSAASFIEALRRLGFHGGAGQQRRGRRHPGDGGPAEAGGGSSSAGGAWTLPAGDGPVLLGRPRGGRDAPKKERDHAMDELRYFAMESWRAERGGPVRRHLGGAAGVRDTR